MADAPRPGDRTPIEQARAYADGRTDDVARDVVAELLASHEAMARAGEEMPSRDDVRVAFVMHGGQGVYDLFALLLTARDHEIATLLAAKERAEKRLAAVLNLDSAVRAALTPHMSDGFVKIASLEVMALIRSRATEGAEGPTGGTT